VKTGIKILTLISVAFLMSSCSPKKVGIDQAWARPANAGENSAIYFVVDNPSTQDDEMVGVACDTAQVMVPAKGQVEFKPGGYHIMLIGLKQNLAVGDTLHVVVTFKNAGQIALDVPVKEP
jgi:copper(I)-binding protein